VPESASGKTPTGQLILWPALITLAITILRLVGELQHWGSPWFSTSAGGGAAIVGISWLPILFGPYFAFKLARAGDSPAGYGKAFAATFGALLVLVLGAVLVGVTEAHPGPLTLLGFLIMLGAAFIPRIGWKSLGSSLLAYAFAARIPVLIVMYLAMKGNWGTHYDVAPAAYANLDLGRKFFAIAFLPQMFLWIGYTVIIGSLFGNIVAALAWRSKTERQIAQRPDLS
jgi:hypothetical protein